MSNRFPIATEIMRSSRLSYREMTWEDTPLIMKWRSDPAIYRYFKHPHAITLEEHSAWFERYKQDVLQISLLICKSESNICIGSLSLHIVEDGKSVEIGYLIGERAQWGAGFATESVGWGSAYAAIRCNLYDQFLIVHQDNRASIRVAEKNGFTANSVINNSPYIRFDKHIFC